MLGASAVFFVGFDSDYSPYSYPVLIHPLYVLSSVAMNVHDDDLMTTLGLKIATMTTTTTASTTVALTIPPLGPTTTGSGRMASTTTFNA